MRSLLRAALAALPLLAACGGTKEGGVPAPPAAAGANARAADTTTRADTGLVAGAAQEAVGGVLSAVNGQDATDAANPYRDLEDPCLLLAREDAERVIGPLRAAPWAHGGTCSYAAADGQRLDVEVQYSGALALAQATGAVRRATHQGLVLDTGRGLDTLDGRWDDATWDLGNVLRARKGDVGVSILLGEVARPDPAAAAQLADRALARLEHPLAYDGSAAQEPPPLVLPGDPCALLTRAEVEAVAGPVAGAPRSEEGKSCTWPLAPAGGRARHFWYNVYWTEGFTEVNNAASAHGLYKANLEDPELAKHTQGKGERGAMRELLQDPAGRQVVGALQGMMRQGGAELADSSLMLKTDPDVPGPWTRAALVGGSDFLAVRKGVAIRAGLGGVGYAAVKALVGKALGKL